MWEEKRTQIDIPVQAPLVHTAMVLELIPVPHLGPSVKRKKFFTPNFQLNWICFIPKGKLQFHLRLL